jgi:hypothetical protein
MTPQEQTRKLVDALNKIPRQPTGGDGRMTAEAVNTSAVAKGQAASNTKVPTPPPVKNSTATYRRSPPDLKKMAVGSTLGQVFGVGTGVGGFVKGMTHSEPAQAQVLDVTQTREYRDAQAAAKQGLIPLFGEDPKNTISRLESEQAAFDEKYRQMTGASSPTEQRILQETNRFNSRARR